MNAKEEFLFLIDCRKVVCAYIRYYKNAYCSPEEETVFCFSLVKNYTKEQLKSFINSLDFEYDNGYGGQELFGIVWFTNGEWASRGEYDGSEWWEIHSCPPIPLELIPSGL